MKEFHQNYAYRPTETEKKGRRIKNQQKDTCKCFVPFVKLHYYDCPALKKSCPIHKSSRYYGTKEEKGEPEQNMIISFYPSSKTERLFQPVKTLLAQCNPDTKVNLQYYSPKSTSSKESIKQHQVQTKSEDERSLNNNVFVEKVKSFESDKTNKMKKLRQCFHSPCNSIAQKSRSQTSIKEKFQDIFRDENKNACDFGNFIPDKPPDEIKNDSNLMWFSNKFDFKDWEKLSRGKIDSDFITVTQQAKKNLINHKIFEIKHKKGLNDLPFVRLPKRSTQLVYSALNVNRSARETSEPVNPQERRYTIKKDYYLPKENSREIDNKQKGDEELSCSNSQTSSSSSVYFTPFIFVPAAATDSDSDGKTRPLWSKEAAETGDEKGKKGLAQTQTPLVDEREILIPEEPKTKSVQLQTDQSGDSTNHEWYHRYTEMAESFTTRGTQTDEVFFSSADESFDSFAMASKNYSDDFSMQDKQTTPPGSSDFNLNCQENKSALIEKKSVLEKSFLSTTRYTVTTTTMNKICQTESVLTQEVYKRQSCKVKSKGSDMKLFNKSTQTTFSLLGSEEEVSEFIDLDSSNVTYVVKPFQKQESDQAIDKLAKAWWGKSHSDSELYGSKRCGCLKPEEIIPLPHSCLCQPSGTRDTLTLINQKSGADKCKDVKASQKKLEKPVTEGKVDKELETSSGEQVCPETPKADKSLGTDSGGHRIYKRADKALGTDSLVHEVPEIPKKVGRVIEKSTENKRCQVTISSSKVEQSPRTAEPVTKPETSVKEDPHTPLSDLSELTRIIQEFFKKAGITSCNCETQTVSEKKIDTRTSIPTKSKKELDDQLNDTQTVKGKKVAVETMTDLPKKPKGEFACAEIPSTSTAAGKMENCDNSDRVKIRRSVLLDDSQTKTRFVCSLCAREISIFSINAATNTETLQTSRKKENITSVSAEVSELVKVKTVKTIQSFDTPKRFTSAPEASPRVKSSDAKEGPSINTFKPVRESLQVPQKSYVPAPRAGSGASNDRSSQVMKPESVKQASTPTGATTTRTKTTTPTATTTRTVTTTAPPITSVLKPPILKRCFCEEGEKVCTVHNCPKLDQNFSLATTSRTAPLKTDNHPSVSRADHSGIPTNQSRTTRRSGDRNRSQRRNPENYFPIFIQSTWPKELALNVTEKSQNVLNDSKSATSQQKRSHEKEAEPTDTPTGKKIKGELERTSRHCFMFGEPASSDFRVDSKLFPSKGGFYWIPSLSASHVYPPKKHNLTQSKTIKSEEKVRGANHPICSESFSIDSSPDLCSTKSCSPAPNTLGGYDKQPFDKLFECRFCKSLTFIKSNKDDVMFSWPHGLIAFRPETPEDRSTTPQNDDDPSESLHRDDSSTQNLEKLLEECAEFSVVSGSPSAEEFLEEEIGEATEEEPELKCQSPDNPSSLDDIFNVNPGANSESFNSFWLNEYAKKE